MAEEKTEPIEVVEEKVVKPKFNSQPVAETKTEVENTKEVKDPEPATEDLFRITEDSYMMDPFFHEIADYFNLERGEFNEAAPALKEIIDYVTNKGKLTTGDEVMVAISKLERVVQPTLPGEKRYKNVYRWAKLANEKTKIEKRMSVFERDNNE